MSDITFVKYCPLCGAENPRQQAFCLSCFDGDLTTVPVEPRRNTASESSRDATNQIEPQPVEPYCTLVLIENPGISFVIRENQTVGRTDKADVVLTNVPKLDWISSAHARFLRRESQWYVQHIGSTNFIKVDGETFSGPEEVAIYDGSILVLSLTSFRVSIDEEN